MIKPITVGTDCSGIDAPIFAFKKLRVPIKHVFSCDINSHAKKSIMANCNPQFFFDDIRRQHKNALYTDFYFLGFPCQSFSSAGKRLGFDDERGNIFFQGFKHIQNAQPKVFILENVKGLLNHNEGNTFSTILRKLKSLKSYNIHYKLLNSKNFGVSQNRERIFIVGIKKHFEKKQFEFPKPYNKPIPHISEFLDKSAIKYPLSNFESNTIKNFFEKYNAKGIDISKSYYIIDVGASPQFSSIMQNISPCLKATRCDYYITKLRRKFTPQECLRLQGFPNSFKKVVSDSQIYKQAGNSITVNVLCEILKQVFKALNI
uniref:DNA (cytosine-5-)-methyltransferase n=1 Tax=viral metagenome TaxID=1070528 RepID=A0A6C0FBU3_9ZZZZ